MGFLDDLKGKAEEFGDKAREGFEAARDKASGLVDDVKDRFDGDQESPAAETAADEVGDLGPAPAADPGDAPAGTTDPVVAPTETTAAPAVDPLGPGDRVGDVVDGPATAVDDADDPPAPPADRTP